MSHSAENSVSAYRGACFGLDLDPEHCCKRRRLSRGGALSASDPWFPSFGCPRFDSNALPEAGDEAVLEVQRDVQRRRRRSTAVQEQTSRLREELAVLLRQEREGEVAVQQWLVREIVAGREEQTSAKTDHSPAPASPSG